MVTNSLNFSHQVNTKVVVMDGIMLGKIKSCIFGACGYQGAMFGARFDISGDGWGVGADQVGGWKIERSKHAKWTEDDRLKAHAEMLLKLSKTMDDAKVEYFHQLKDKPVECIFDNGLLKEWRILKEVL